MSRLDGEPSDGIHLFFNPPSAAGYSVQGFSVWRRDAAQAPRLPSPPCASVLPSALDALHLRGRAAAPGLGRLLFRKLELGTGRVRALARFRAAPPGATEGFIYELTLRAPCNGVEVHADGWFTVALFGDRAVDSHAPASGLLRGPVDRLVIHAPAPLTSLAIWPGPALDAAADDPGWQLVAKNLQLPIEAADPTLHGVAAERAQAESRLLPGERLEGDFAELSELLNHAVRDAPRVPPPRACTGQRPNTAVPYLHHRPWATAMGLLLDPAWRRALGLGFCDPASGLRAGQLYDYKVAGWFRRRDLEERRIDFASVPLETPCGPSFALGGVTVHLAAGTQVVAEPALAPGALMHPYRKGVHFKGGLTLGFSAPLRRVALLLAPIPGATLTWRADPVPPSSGPPLNGTLPAESRVVLEFPAAVERVSLEGAGFFMGVCEPCVPETADLEAPVERVATVLGVKLERQPLPAPPRLQRAANLQHPLRPGVTQPVHALGFRVRWLPPAMPGRLPELLWPPDLPAAPPTEITRYLVERAADGARSPFLPYDHHLDPGSTGLVVPSRGRPDGPVAVTPGADLLALFPEKVRPVPPVSPWVELEDVLMGQRRPATPRPGSRHRYRISSQDALGRRSAPATTAALVLRKHLPPPAPPGPDPRLEPPPRPDRARPAGVYARVVQRGEPGLDDLDRLALGDRRGHVTVLHFSWGEEQRQQDPFASELRIYWRRRDPARLTGKVSGPVVSLGDRFRVPAVLDQPVRADELAGRILELGRSAFPVLRHGAGTRIDLEVPRPRAEPAAVPGTGTFHFIRLPDGAESRPERWGRRVRVLSIPAAPAYVHFAYVVERDLLLSFPGTPPAPGPEIELYSITAAGPSVRGWVGVSAADSEPYVRDRVGGPLGGRPGNESAVVPAQVWAEHRGRPALKVPVPPDAEVVPLAEVGGEEVEVRMRLRELLPGWSRREPLRLERAAGAELARLLVARPAGVFLRRHDGAGPEEELGTDLAARLRGALARGGPLDSTSLWRLATSGAANLEPLWKQVGTSLVAATDTVLDRVPNSPERFFYRVKVADERGRRSEGAAFLERIFRVPDRSPPPAPALDSVRVNEARVTVGLSAPVNVLVSGLLLFPVPGPVDDARALSETVPELLRSPNRPDLYPNRGIRARLQDGTLLAPIFLPASASTPVAGTRRARWEATFESAPDTAVGIWAAAISPDGIPSLLTGPRVASLGPAPPVPPPLMVRRRSGVDEARWTAQIDLMGRLEAAPAPGDQWSAVSPWLPGGLEVERQIAVPPGGGRQYRLRVRGPGGREAVGEPVRVGP